MEGERRADGAGGHKSGVVGGSGDEGGGRVLYTFSTGPKPSVTTYTIALKWWKQGKADDDATLISGTAFTKLTSFIKVGFQVNSGGAWKDSNFRNFLHSIVSVNSAWLSPTLLQHHTGPGYALSVNARTRKHVCRESASFPHAPVRPSLCLLLEHNSTHG